MKKRFTALAFLMLSIGCITQVRAQEERHWWESGPWGWPQPNPQAKLMPLISVSGNSFVNPEGDTILFRGLAISDSRGITPWLFMRFLMSLPFTGDNWEP